MKQKQYVSRRQRVIRRLAALLVLAALFLTTGLYRVFPSQIIRGVEKRTDCGRTEILFRLGHARLEKEKPNQIYISGNEKALVFTVATLTLRRGWEEASSIPGVVDCTTEAPLHAGIFGAMTVWSILKGDETWDTEEEAMEAISNQYRYNRLLFAYGRVDDPRAALVRVKVCYEVEGEWETVYSVDIPQSQWYHKDGRTYFAEEFYRGENWFVDTSAYTGWATYQAELLDGEGNLIYRDENLPTASAGLSG